MVGGDTRAGQSAPQLLDQPVDRAIVRDAHAHDPDVERAESGLTQDHEAPRTHARDVDVVADDEYLAAYPFAPAGVPFEVDAMLAPIAANFTTLFRAVGPATRTLPAAVAVGVVATVSIVAIVVVVPLVPVFASAPRAARIAELALLARFAAPAVFALEAGFPIVVGGGDRGPGGET